MRYKDHYDTFWELLRKRGKVKGVLYNKRAIGIWPFLWKFLYVFWWDCRTKGIKKTSHDWFIGTRKLFIACVLVTNIAYADIQTAFSPGSTELIIKTIGEAKESIEVAAYSFTSVPIAKALLGAQDKGVNVRIVLDKSQRTANYSSYNFFINHDVPVRINAKYSIMHNKFMIIDGKILQTGSFNYTKAAEEKNAENVIVIRNEPITIKAYQLQWLKLWKEAN